MRSFSFLVLALCSVLPAQHLYLSSAPATPGSTIAALVTPAPGESICASSSHLVLMTKTGDLISPRLHVPSGTWNCAVASPGLAMTIDIPATGPGSNGSYLAYFPYLPGLVARLDVGTPSPDFPALHTFNAGIYFGLGGHAVFPSTAASTPTWCFCNTSNVPHTFTASDYLAIVSPGSDQILRWRSLEGMTVLPGRRVLFSLPMEGMMIGPYEVIVNWNDPQVGPSRRVLGIHTSATSDLHLPGGHVVPLGGSLQTVSQFNFNAQMAQPQTRVLIGYEEGVTPISATRTLPLALDPLVLASLAGQLNPLLQTSTGTQANGQPLCTGYCSPSSAPGTFTFEVNIVHPGAAFSGLELRVAAVSSILNGEVQSTQSERIRLQ